MIFPHTFSSPAEAVKAIYEMKQSNPWVIIDVTIELEDNEMIERNCLWSHMWPYTLVLDSSHTVFPYEYSDDGDKYMYTSSHDRPVHVSSITITSIQAVEPKLEIGDNVYVISTWEVWSVEMVNPGNSRAYLSGNWDMEWYAFRDLIKLPEQSGETLYDKETQN